MNSIGEMVAAAWQQLFSPFGTKHESAAIDGLAKLQHFLANRSAFVAQTLLLDYVKARVGERYRYVFEDERLAASIKIVQLDLFAACLSDLTVYAVAVLGDRNDADKMAQNCYIAALHEKAGDAPAPFSVHAYIGEFVRRLAVTDWRVAARELGDFIHNPHLLLRSTSILDEPENSGGEALENTVKLTLSELRGEFDERLDAGAVVADWLRQSSS